MIIATQLTQAWRQGHTLPQVLSARAASSAEAMAFLDRDGTAHALPYAELCRQAQGAARRLRAAGVRPGDPVLLCCDSEALLVQAFWAVLYAGAVAVPLSVPRGYAQTDEALQKLIAVHRQCSPQAGSPQTDRPALLITDLDRNALARVDGWRQAIPEACIHPADALLATAVSDDATIDLPDNADRLALLMFSSGSTGDPKGVRLSHRELLANCAQIAERSELRASDRSLSWLPLTHDMGLVLFHLCHTLAGLAQYKMTPLAFARDPGGFLDRASALRASLLGMPNFGFDQLLRAAAEAQAGRWALGAVRLIYNGAEPIDPQLCRDVYCRLADFGLPAGTISPGWGIAEASVVATQFSQSELAARGALPTLHLADTSLMTVGGPIEVRTQAGVDTREIVALGPVMPGMQLRVLDDEGRELPPRHLGHLQLHGPNVSRGYLGHEDVEWCASGDLGFVHDGIVYLTGRAKDVLFINGRNHFSNDLETALCRRLDWPANQLAVVGITDPLTRRERVVVFFRQGREAERTAQAERLRSALEDLLAYPVAAAIGVASLPKTTSGKIRRFALRQALLHGEYTPVLNAADATAARALTAAEQALSGLLRDLLPTLPPDLDPTLSLSRYGLDSVGFMQLAFRIQQHYRRELPAQTLLQAASLAAIAQLVEAPLVEAPIAARAADDCQYGRTVPMTPRQQMLWSAWLLDPQATTYNETYGLTVTGAVDQVRWLDAARRVIACHPMLSAIVLDSAAPALVLHPVQRADAERMECAAGDLDAVLSDLAAQPFDLRRGPLLRLRLIETHAGITVFVSAHHLVVDGWSLQLLVSQIFAVYAGGEMPAVESQLWFHPVRCNAAVRKDWQQRLAAADAVQLPTTVPSGAGRGPVQTHRRTASAATTAALQAWRRQHGSEFTAIAAALAVLMSRLAAVERPVLGTVMHGRFDAASESRVGYFATTHPLLADLARDTGFSSLVASFDQQRMALLGGDAPDLAMLADGAGAALAEAIRVIYVHQNMPAIALPDGLRATAQTAFRGLARCDLTVTSQWFDDQLAFAWEYDSHRFNAAQMAGYAELFEHLLAQLLAEPERPLAQADLLSPAQRALWQPYQATITAVDFDQSVVARFEAAVARTPDLPAVSDGHARYSYRELRECVDALCLRLDAAGLGIGERVCLLTDRSADYVVALLAGLKLGAVVIPIDPALPADRIAMIVEDSDAALLLTTPGIALDPAITAGRHAVCFSGATLERGASFAARPLASDAAAYLIYTSGSTGRPKGVLNTHRCLTNLVHWATEAFAYRAGETICQFAPFSFDVSIAEILPSLCAGLHVHVLSNERRASPELYLQTLHEQRVNVATVTPAYLAVVNELPAQCREQLGALRLLILGGEALRTEEVERFRAHSPQVRIVNVYGPTETTVLSTAYPLPQPLQGERATQPLGLPIANTEVWVLDEQDRACPATVTGTVYIGGDGLAQGYWRDHERTDQAFRMLAPDGGVPRRFYCSGDLARLGVDGLLDFVGRADTQIKLRGFRIELGEIETTLAQMAGVDGVVVKAIAHEGGERVLVAYHGGESHPRSTLDAFLRARLPVYMLPSHYQHISQWPLTANRKVDRQRLPDPDWNALDRGSHHVPPQGHTEQRLAAIWSELLGQSGIGRDDHFFLLGGSSLSAVQLANRIRERFARNLALPAVMQQATLREMAALIDAESDAATVDAGPVRGRATTLKAVPASDAQARMVFLDRSNPGSPLNNIPLTLALSQPLDPARLRVALEALAQRHPMLRTAFDVGDDGVTMRTRDDIAIDLEVSTVANDSAAIGLLHACHNRGYDLGLAPLWRTALVCASDSGRTWLALDMHHAIADGVTLVRMLTELDALYQGARLPAIDDEISYADYVVWQRDRLAGEYGERARAYWNEPARHPPRLPLPASRNDRVEGRQFIAALDPRQTATLRNWCQQHGVSPFVAMLGVFGLALGQRCDRRDFALGVTFGGRPHSALETVPGLFVNTLPLSFCWDPDHRFGDFMQRTRTQLAELHGFEDYPLNRVMALNQQRELPFNVLFNEEVLPAQLSFDGAPAALESIGIGIAKMPLLISFMFGDDVWRWRVEHRLDGPEPQWVHALLDDVRALVSGLADFGDVRIGNVRIGDLQSLDSELLALLGEP